MLPPFMPFLKSGYFMLVNGSFVLDSGYARKLMWYIDNVALKLARFDCRKASKFNLLHYVELSRNFDGG